MIASLRMQGSAVPSVEQQYTFMIPAMGVASQM